jgi:pimeloyl-ACP methyl ester carboxylesterase
MMNDADVINRFRIVAFDMLYHGCSTPPDGWWLKTHHFTNKLYLEIIRAVWVTLGLDRPIVLSCSMGGAIADTNTEATR